MSREIGKDSVCWVAWPSEIRFAVGAANFTGQEFIVFVEAEKLGRREARKD